MKRTPILVGVVSALAVLVVASAALAAKAPNNGNGNTTTTTTTTPAPEVFKASAALNIGQVVKPRPKATKAGASGRFTATITGLSMKWTLTFKQLSGDATAAHIHAGKRGVNNPAPEIVLCAATCASGANGTVVLTQPQLDAMKKGNYYVNVHTAKNAGGEIRGQVAVAGK